MAKKKQIEPEVDDQEREIPVATFPRNWKDTLNAGQLSASYLVNLVQSLGWPIHPNAHIMIVSGGAYVDPSRNLKINLYPVETWEFANKCRTPLMVGKTEDDQILAVRLPLFVNRDEETVELQLLEDRGLS